MVEERQMIALPIETKSREFDGKLWLALNLIDRGYNISIGPSPEVRDVLDIVKPDIYITKDIGDNGVGFYEILHESGISICGLNTEGGVFQSINKFAENMTEFLEYIDAHCTWGQKQADAIQQHYGSVGNMFVTGNPRFDLLQPELRFLYEERSAELNEEYGDYILFNGNFSLANPYSDSVVDLHEEIYGHVRDEERDYANRIFYLFTEAIYHLHNEFPEINIVIRPHPSENNATYNAAFGGYERVHIEDAGDVRDWIAGASVVIHHDCTTGIESAMMGTPVVSYRPIQNEKYEARLPQIVSHEALSRENLTDYVGSSLKSRESYEMDKEQVRKLKQYFHNVDQSAAELICDVIESLNTTKQRDYEKLRPEGSNLLKRRVRISRWSDQATVIYDRIHEVLGNESIPKSREYRKQKFPGLEKDELRDVIDKITPLLNIDTISIEEVPLTNNTYYLGRV